LADSPETYKTFLEILHTYQKEQKGIREVCNLFQVPSL
jgi:histone deacetylase complex regulatory component SIN3